MNCINCNKQTNNPKFCGRSCAASYNNKINPKRKPENKCKICQQSISTSRKHCKKCWKLINTVFEVEKIPKKYIYEKTNICLHCTKPSFKKFCCLSCHIRYTFLQRVKIVDNLGYIYDKTKFNTSATFAKKYLIYKHGNKCSICNIENKWNHLELKLILDHINGIPNDWSISNLRLVCPNCDSQLPTFKSKNKGKGRPRGV